MRSIFMFPGAPLANYIELTVYVLVFGSVVLENIIGVLISVSLYHLYISVIFFVKPYLQWSLNF